MKQRKQSKIVAILALCVSVLGLTLGFAAFSNTLTISSSATVSPNKEDFNMKIYGAPEGFDMIEREAYKMYTLEDAIYPITINSGIKYKNMIDGEKAIIDNSTYTISNLGTTFTKPNQAVYYAFYIENTGHYDSYIKTDFLETLANGIQPKSCTAGAETTESLVNDVCPNIVLKAKEIMDRLYQPVLNKSSNGVFKLEQGKTIQFLLAIEYCNESNADTCPRADGDFSVEFDPITIEFSSVAPTE